MESNQSNTNNGVFVTPNIFDGMADKELFQIMKESQRAGSIVFMLKEITLRQQKIIADMKNRIAVLENKTLKAKGRKKQEFFLNEMLLSDDEIVRLIDGEYFTNIRELEKKVGAGKNQLRNRYNREKKRLEIIERQQDNQQQ